MSVTVKWKPETTVLGIDSYNVYRSNNQTPSGPYTLIGNVAHALLSELSFLDNPGTLNDYYKVTTLNISNEESLATDAIKPFDNSGLTRLYDTIYGPDRKPKVGVKVSVTLDVPQAEINGIIYGTAPVIAITDSNGVWFVDLFPNASLQPAGTEYIVSIQGVTPPQRLTLPAAALVQYSAIVTP